MMMGYALTYLVSLGVSNFHHSDVRFETIDTLVHISSSLALIHASQLCDNDKRCYCVETLSSGLDDLTNRVSQGVFVLKVLRTLLFLT